jgi:hypothetical protein
MVGSQVLIHKEWGYNADVKTVDFVYSSGNLKKVSRNASIFLPGEYLMIVSYSHL